MKKKIRLDNIVCKSCGGRGLYTGFAEHGGAAVICIYCKGTGKTKFEMDYEEFKERKKDPKIKRVFQTSGGYGVSADDVTTKEGKTIHFSLFGVPYEDWLKGKKPVPIKELHCPYQHTSQDLQCNDKNNLYKKRCSSACGLGGLISQCGLRGEMDRCWRIYDGLEKS